ncbi:hypothetical protein ACFPTO_23445 [Paraburkholderia denitrificans]|uniref:Uncharacterized protein n=1 Tax=Paraburkholderia denitrificans TaxID=694025 RepID=A0ABW0JEV2_9BURK
MVPSLDRLHAAFRQTVARRQVPAQSGGVSTENHKKTMKLSFVRKPWLPPVLSWPRFYGASIHRIFFHTKERRLEACMADAIGIQPAKAAPAGPVDTWNSY